jgi:hypothetical protein
MPVSRAPLAIGVLALGLAVGAVPALAYPDPYFSQNAYDIDKFGEFGTLNLLSGKRTDIGATGITSPAGLAESASGALYTAHYTTNQFYSIDPTTGVATLVPVAGGIIYGALGSTTSAIYTISQGGELFSIDPIAGTSTDIGATGLPHQPNSNKVGLSVNGTGLYAVSPTGLYSIDTTTGASTFLGPAGAGSSDSDLLISLLWIGATLYGGSDPATDLLTIDPTTGAVLNSAVSTPTSGSGVATLFGLAPIAASVVPVPEPAGGPILGLGALGAIALFAAGRRRLI